MDSSSEKSDSNESSPDQLSSNEGEEEVIEVYSQKREDIHKSLGYNEGKIQLEIKEPTFEPKWKSDAGGYFWKVRIYTSSATEPCEKRRKKKLKKSAFHTKPITDRFLVQYNRNSLHHSMSLPTLLLPPFLPKSLPHQVVKKVETKFMLQTQAVYDLEELLHLKSQPRNKYGHKLSHRLSYYQHHQIVKSFL